MQSNDNRKDQSVDKIAWMINIENSSENQGIRILKGILWLVIETHHVGVSICY